MLCKGCMVVMEPGTRYEQQKGQVKLAHKRYFECRKGHDRVYYVNTLNFQEMLENVKKK